jgi:DnaJ like chaperone protein
MVVIVGLVVGYWLVSWLIVKLRASNEEAPSSSSTDRRSNHQDAPRGGSAQPSAVPKTWHQVLEVSERASLDDIKLAYRRKIAQHHPDKTSGLGVELTALAEVKTKEINAAYHAALDAQRRNCG